ncbi:ROK family transcriptional regulator [Lentzea aerocolonigenes]|uniref:ROK family transcriptional regulator n=1 Tax=Lentzea aerocolonigenes TaxID=68170 RepID=A0A0F0H9R8_LENAE|nr:ROK family protein [Lentzea aerocolonigenes]KJK51596.1 ROK family transcriptional regulator [Lentzea aerocolonigenes]
MPVLGVDVGGTATKAVLVDDAGAVLDVRSRPTPRRGPSVVPEVLDLVAELAWELPAERIGVAVPGIVDERRGVGVFSENLGWHDVPFKDLLADRLGRTVAFTHDVRAGALAENRIGGGRGAHTMLFLPLGTGIAAALVTGGRVHDGDGYAGELGHVDVGHGEPCLCGGTGCLEAIASASAIARRYTALTGREVCGAVDVARRVEAGEPEAAAVWDDAVEALVTALAWTASVLAPEVVVVGGGLSGANGLLLDPLAKGLSARLTFQREPRLVPAALGGLAGCHGAALAAIADHRGEPCR